MRRSVAGALPAPPGGAGGGSGRSRLGPAGDLQSRRLASAASGRATPGRRAPRAPAAGPRLRWPAAASAESNGGSMNTTSKARRRGAGHPGERIGALDPDRVRLAGAPRSPPGPDDVPIALQQHDLGGAARCGLEAERARAGEGVEAAPAGEVVAEPVEHGLADAVRCRPQARRLADRQLLRFQWPPMTDADLARRRRSTVALLTAAPGCRRAPAAPWPARTVNSP